MPATAKTPERLISAAEVAAHASPASCWAVFRGRVFDVTAFLDDHPGGADFILDAVREKGRNGDVGPSMLDPLVHSHSDSAFEMLEGMCIGILASEDKATNGSAIGKANGAKTVNGNANGKANARDFTEPEEGIRETHKALGVARTDFIDPAKPMLAQVFTNNYSKKVYLEQVHIPRHVSGSAPIFGNFLEPLTKTPWWIVPLVWVPFGQAHTAYAYYLGLPLPELAIYWALGLVVWSLIEYSLHRWLFHMDRVLPDNKYALTLHFLAHGIHHFLPMDK